MDNLCHTLVGAALGESGLKQRTRYGNATLMIASNLPDVDVLVFLTGESSVAFRRGWTHGVVAQLVLPVALTAAVWGWDRLRRRRRPEAGEPLRLGWILLLSYLALYLHLFFDYLNNYGIRLLAPLNWRWFYGDAVFIIDPWLWMSLGVGVWLARKRNAIVAARAAVVFALCYVALMLLSARAARDVVADLWREARGSAPRALMVGPNPVTPFSRAVIVDAGDRYETGTFTWWPTGVTFEGPPVPTNANHPAVPLAREQSEDIRNLLVWSRFPFWVIEQTPEGTRVTLGDMRFVGAPGGRGAAFQASTLLADR